MCFGLWNHLFEKSIMQIFLRLYILCLLIISTVRLNAQTAFVDLIEDNTKPQVVNFRLVQGFIVVDVYLQYLFRTSFILDSGARHTIIFRKDLAKLTGMHINREINLKGSDIVSDVRAYVASGVNIQLDKCLNVKRDILVLEYDYLRFGEFIGEEIHGILGAEFFRNLVMEIDFIKSKINLWHPKYYKNPKLKEFHSCDVDFVDFKPYLKSSLSTGEGTSKPLTLLFDTGASLSVLLYQDPVSGVSLPGNVIPGTLGKGLGGELFGFIGRLNELTIADVFQLNQPVAYFQQIDSIEFSKVKTSKNGIIGNQVISRFDVILDYHNEALYLRPNKSFKEEFEYDRSGLTIFAFGQDLKKYIITDVLPGSPGYEAGIRPGDVIKKIGFWPLSFYKLTDINSRLTGKAGNKIKMQVLREGKVLKKEFVLRDLF